MLYIRELQINLVLLSFTLPGMLEIGCLIERKKLDRTP